MSETFDTLAAARQLQDAGMEQPHAEAVADVVSDSRDALATKADIAIVIAHIHTMRRVIGLNFTATMAALAAIVVVALMV